MSQRKPSPLMALALLVALLPFAGVSAWADAGNADSKSLPSAELAAQSSASATFAASGPAAHQKTVYVDVDLNAMGDVGYVPLSTFADQYTYDGMAHIGYGTIQFVDMDIVDWNIVNNSKPPEAREPRRDPRVAVPYKVTYQETYDGKTYAASEAKNAATYTLVVELVNSMDADAPIWYEYKENAFTHTFVINPRPVSIVADDQEMIAGKRRPVFTWHLKEGSLAAGDSLIDVAENPGDYTAYVEANTKKAGKYPIQVLEGDVAKALVFKRNYFFAMGENGVLTVLAPTYGLGLVPSGHYAFPSAIIGYDPIAPLEGAFTNNGNSDLTGITVSVMGAQAACFELGGTTQAGLLEGGESLHFTLAPVQGLSIGSYSATVYVNGAYETNQSFTVSFTVEPRFSSEQTGEYGDGTILPTGRSAGAGNGSAGGAGAGVGTNDAGADAGAGSAPGAAGSGGTNAGGMGKAKSGGGTDAGSSSGGTGSGSGTPADDSSGGTDASGSNGSQGAIVALALAAVVTAAVTGIVMVRHKNRNPNE